MSDETRGVTPGPWRVGSKVRRTIYRGNGPDDLIGVMGRPEDAAYAALARTEWPEAVRRLHEAEDEAKRLKADNEHLSRIADLADQLASEASSEDETSFNPSTYSVDGDTLRLLLAAIAGASFKHGGPVGGYETERANSAEAEAERLKALLARTREVLVAAEWGGYSCPGHHLIDTQTLCDLSADIRKALDETT